MSSRSYFYNKHQSRSRSYYGKKKMYGSAYQPGQTTKYQRYGRTMRLDPSYISIPRELPTRQSQLRQLEELRKAGLIPAPVPPPIPVTYNYLADVFLPSYSSDMNRDLGTIIYNRCISKGNDPSNLIGVSFSGKFHYTPSAAAGYTNVFTMGSFKSSASDPEYTSSIKFKTTSTTAIDVIYNMVFMNPEIVYDDSGYKLRSKKVRVFLQGTVGSNTTSLIYNSSNNNLISYQTSQGIPLNDPNWNNLSSKYFVWVDTPEPTEEVPYYYYESNAISYGRVLTSGNVIPFDAQGWESIEYKSLWTRFPESDANFANSTINNGIVLEFAIPQE